MGLTILLIGCGAIAGHPMEMRFFVVFMFLRFVLEGGVIALFASAPREQSRPERNAPACDRARHAEHPAARAQAGEHDGKIHRRMPGECRPADCSELFSPKGLMNRAVFV
jgi:hypothetical protein